MTGIPSIVMPSRRQLLMFTSLRLHPLNRAALFGQNRRKNVEIKVVDFVRRNVKRIQRMQTVHFEPEGTIARIPYICALCKPFEQGVVSLLHSGSVSLNGHFRKPLGRHGDRLEFVRQPVKMISGISTISTFTTPTPHAAGKPSRYSRPRPEC